MLYGLYGHSARQVAQTDKPSSGSTDTTFIPSLTQESIPTILAAAGFRILAVDRIGYGKSSKAFNPLQFQFRSCQHEVT